MRGVPEQTREIKTIAAPPVSVLPGDYASNDNGGQQNVGTGSV